MKSFLIKVKKFFSILFSFLFGIFSRKTKDDDHSLKNDEIEEQLEDSSAKVGNTQIYSLEESSSSKGMDSFLYLKEDFERLYRIIQQVSKIESQLKTEMDELTLEELKKDWESIKQGMKFLENKYRKVEKEQKEIEDFLTKLDVTKRLVDQVEKKIERMTLLFQNKDFNENKEEITENIEVKSKEFEESLKKEKLKYEHRKEPISKVISTTPKNKESIVIADHPKKEEISNVFKNQEDFSYDQVIDSYEELVVESTILSSIIIKDNIDMDSLIEVKKDKEEKSSEQALREDKNKKTTQIKKHDMGLQNVSKKVEKRKKNSIKIKKVSKANLRKCSVNLNSLKSRIAILRSHRNIRSVSHSIKKALGLSATITMLMLSKTKSSKLLAVNLMMNNHIRKARSVHNKRMKPLDYDLMAKTIFKNRSLDSQVDIVMKNTLNQIKQLKVEIYTNYELTEEIKKLLDELDTMEVEVRSNLDQMNEKNSEKHRTR